MSSMNTDETIPCCAAQFPTLSCDQFNSAIALATTLGKHVIEFELNGVVLVKNETSCP